ncbi:hypothetical protein BCR44DRAFT_1208988 [Catenaria anguillulae PL171]|uniref:Uncharacterized protein n=1 Tax=Catenaria anguillulae PL171 TaxID=765915 RepID=A0A1Y2GY17_9FUNG|nr:hypothetical protein BCR44DRAFT_1208988 [Catenaria anguillulae PL171]
MNPGLPTSTVDSSHRPQLHPNLANDTQPYQPSPLRSVENNSPDSFYSTCRVACICPCHTSASRNHIPSRAHDNGRCTFIHLWRNTAALSSSHTSHDSAGYAERHPVCFHKHATRFVQPARRAIRIRPLCGNCRCIQFFPIPTCLYAHITRRKAQHATSAHPPYLPLIICPNQHSAVASPPPAAPPSTKSPMPPATPARAHPVSGKTSASQRTPTQPKVGKSSPDSSSLSSASSTPPFTKPLARSATLPPSGLKSSASSVAPSSSASGSAGGARRGQGGQSASKKQPPAAPEPPSIVPLPIGVVTVDMVRSPSLLLPLYFVRADGVVYETGRSFLFRLDETVLGSGNVVVLE